LLLREWAAPDLITAHTIHADPEVMRYMTGQAERLDETHATLERWIASAVQRPRTAYNFAVVLQANQGLLGRCGLYLNADPRIAHLGYHLQRGLWGQGYTTEAAQALMQFGFQQLRLHRIYAECHPDNRASARVMEKLGMQYEGHLRQNHWANGMWWDTLVYGCLHHEWIAATEPLIDKDSLGLF
jgi:[ribosomal protein S5]-alanine N-acetyltransferase